MLTPVQTDTRGTFQRCCSQYWESSEQNQNPHDDCGKRGQLVATPQYLSTATAKFIQEPTWFRPNALFNNTRCSPKEKAPGVTLAINSSQFSTFETTLGAMCIALGLPGTRRMLMQQAQPRGIKMVRGLLHGMRKAELRGGVV